MKKWIIIVLGGLLISLTSLVAGEADVLDVKVTAERKEHFRFDVTVAHQDTGWQHYANRWEILDANGNLLGTRELLHPHEDEQPFTRSLADVHVPLEIKEVQIRAHDLVHGYGGQTRQVRLPGR